MSVLSRLAVVYGIPEGRITMAKKPSWEPVYIDGKLSHYVVTWHLVIRPEEPEVKV